MKTLPQMEYRKFCEQMSVALTMTYGDTEAAHLEADEIVVRVFKRLGLRKLAKIYDEVTSKVWYA